MIAAQRFEEGSCRVSIYLDEDVRREMEKLI